MTVLYICAVYPPEREPAGIMAAQLAGMLVSQGHQVTIICPFPNRPDGALYSGYRRQLRQVEYHDGLRLVRSPSWLVGKQRRWWPRILENLTFGLSSAFNAWREGRPDVLIVETWPLLATQFALWLASKWRVPAINYIQDVYPESLENAGFVKRGGMIAKWLLAWDRELCASSWHLVVISEGMRKLVCARRPEAAGHVSVVHNWVDGNEIRPLANGDQWRRAHGIPTDAFVALFAGTMGFVSGADVLIEAARLLQGRSSILILCVGEGVLKAEMMRQAAEAQLANIRFLGFQPQVAVGEMHAAGDVLLLTTRPNAGDASVPSKLMTYLASGRPIVCSAPGESETARIVRDSGAGVLTAPQNANGIAEALEFLAGHRHIAERMGSKARDYFESHFTFDDAYARIAEVLEQAKTKQKERVAAVQL